MIPLKSVLNALSNGIKNIAIRYVLISIALQKMFLLPHLFGVTYIFEGERYAAADVPMNIEYNLK